MSHARSITGGARRTARRALATAFACALVWSALPAPLRRMVMPAAEAAAFVVTNTNDSGAGSLRAAILNANATPGPAVDSISFSIPVGGFQTIKPLTPLPAITTPTVIDGYTQPGTQANTLAVGSNALILVELNGSLAGVQAVGLRVQSGGVTIRGLAINRFDGAGIEIKNSFAQTQIQGNFIGIDVTGTTPIASNTQSRGIEASNCSNVLIGGTTPAARNVISDNGIAGVYLTDGANSNVVKGNLIGTNKAGTSAVPNAAGISITGSGNVIGGSEPGAGNVISGNDSNGISVSSNGSGGNTIAGNLIGTSASGGAPLGNGSSGIDLFGSNNMVGGASPGARNVISANSSGVTMRGYTPDSYAPSGNFIQGNYIGTDITGQLDFGNELIGVGVMGSNVVGGASVAEGNRIAFNKIGVYVSRSDDPTEETATPVLSNSIYSNDELGIDLRVGAQSEGVTPNDGFFDLDTGPNGYQNFPALASATSAAGQTAVTGSLNSRANTTYTIQFFADDECDPTGHGEGETFLGSTQVTTTAGGVASFSVTLPVSVPAGHWVTATATDPLNKTSEFSLSRQVSAAPLPALSVGDVAVAEGNSGQTDAPFNVTLSASSNLPVSVNYATANPAAPDHAHGGEDYIHAQGTLTFAPGETSKQVAVAVIGDSAAEPDEVFVLQLSNPAGATLADDTGACTIQNDDAPTPTPTPTPGPTPAPNVFEFAQSQYAAQEDSSHVTVTVKRTGDTSSEASVDYATQSDTATERGEFTTAVGTLRFAAGETQKTFEILLTEDSHDESDEEQANILLSNPRGATLGQPSSARLMIADDASEPAMNASDDAELFVRQHYHDFLNREADASGLAFWTGELAQCGGDPGCLDVKRQHVSAAFFLSIEFQQTGFLVHRLTRASFARMPRYREFVRDARALGEGVVVGQGLWQQQLEQNKQAFIAAWVSRAEFRQKYDGMLNGEYVDALYANAGVAPSASERQQLVDGLDQLTETRGSALLKVAAHPSLVQSEKGPAFVLMQYFGYLRRDPDDAPDSDMSGHDYWLSKLNQFGGNFQKAEMVRAFLASAEYRSRFGQP